MLSRALLRFGLAVAAVVVSFAAVTLFALEGSGVAVLHTRQPDGSERRTRVWYAEDDGALWIEAAEASRPFYSDLASRPELSVEWRASPFDRLPAPKRAHAVLVPEPGGHDRIRALLAAKYGWADAWIARLTDTSASRAVRIVIDDGN